MNSPLAGPSKGTLLAIRHVGTMYSEYRMRGRALLFGGILPQTRHPSLFLRNKNSDKPKMRHILPDIGLVLPPFVKLMKNQKRY